MYNYPLTEDIRRIFSITDYKPGQEHTIGSIMSGRDTISLLPTGGGKSLTFQIPALNKKPDLTIVVSPLIALMDDQVMRSPNELGAVRMHSSMDREELDMAEDRIKSGGANVVYASPERLNSNAFGDILGRRKTGLLVVDEAHCASLWGHDFRAAYLLIPEIRDRLGMPNIAALTATAPPNVLEDMIKILQLRDPEIIKGEVIRDNIEFRVQNLQSQEEKFAELTKVLKERSKIDGSIIIYENLVREVEGLYERLYESGFNIGMFHGRMEPREKRNSQDDFMKGEYNIMVATNAFGMGIDKADIHTIIHHSLPPSLEAYVQEIGRAGRDGRESIALLLTSYRDQRALNEFLLHSNPSIRILQKVYRGALRYAGDKPDEISFSKLAKVLVSDTDEWWGNRVNTSLGILLSLGYISKVGGKIGFPQGEDIIIDPELLEKKIRDDERKLRMIRDYTMAEDREGTIRSYFTGTYGRSEDQVNDTLQKRVSFQVLAALSITPMSGDKLGQIFCGDAKKIDNGLDEYNGMFQEISSIYVRHLINGELIDEGLVEKVTTNRNLTVLTRRGADKLTDNSVEIPEQGKPLANPLDFRNKEIISSIVLPFVNNSESVRDSEDGKKIAFKPGERMFEAFQALEFQLDKDKVSGKDLLLAFLGKTRGKITIDDFRNFMRFYGNLDIALPSREKNKR